MKNDDDYPIGRPRARGVVLRAKRYKPFLRIGCGGMANVYLAREVGDGSLARVVALKVMHKHLARSDGYRKRFFEEARVQSQVIHPNVCRVLGLGESAGRPFMAMEYLVGEPLSRIWAATGRRADEASAATRARLFSKVIAELAEGLHAAHETRNERGELMDIVHRDISPHNLFLLYDGTVRVLDFGIAKFSGREVQTSMNALVGKAGYMAPERIKGRAIDRRADVWALGVVLWEMVALTRLFKRTTEVRSMRAVCSEPIPMLADLVSDLPEGLDAVLTRALEREPERRYRTAREFANALDDWLAETGPPITRTTASEFLNGFFPRASAERQRWAKTLAAGARPGPFLGSKRLEVSSVRGGSLNPFE